MGLAEQCQINQGYVRTFATSWLFAGIPSFPAFPLAFDISVVHPDVDLEVAAR